MIEGSNSSDVCRLQGRRIVITGAGSGIGLATARLFFEHGAKLILIDRDPGALKDFEGHPDIRVFNVDVTDEAAIDDAIKNGATALGGIDGVVNAAGIMLRGSIRDVSVDQWKRVLDVNLTGTYIVIKSCLSWLEKEPAATIVNIGSGQGLLPNSPDRSAYAASKGGVVNLTRALAAELAPGIRANSVCPGLVNTPMASAVKANVNNYALGRLAEPSEIARAVLFLTSNESSYITGAALAADGGRAFH